MKPNLPRLRTPRRRTWFSHSHMPRHADRLALIHDEGFDVAVNGNGYDFFVNRDILAVNDDLAVVDADGAPLVGDAVDFDGGHDEVLMLRHILRFKQFF